jgi:hypothetical protein
MVPSSVEPPKYPSPFSAGAALLPHVAPPGIFTPNLRSPTRGVIGYVRRLVESCKPFVERRGAPRLSVTFSARAVVLDETWKRAGDEFFVVVRDISVTGIGLLTSAPVDGPYLAIELAADCGETLLVTVAVLRCRPIGPCFDVGGEFVPRPAEV